MILWASDNLRLARNDRLAELDSMVGVMSLIPTGGNFIFYWNFFNPLDVYIVQKCQIVLKMKTSSDS